ncbi:MAG: sigma-54-dependent transcriptional regulator [Janthinobacterium lividum]
MHDGLKVIFIEDDELVRRANVQSLQLAGIAVVGHANAESALPLIDAALPGIVVCDVKLPGISGLDLLTHCHDVAPDVPVILVTGHGDITMAVRAMRDGAYDFIEKPFAADRLLDTVYRALAHRKLWLENRALRRELAAGEEGGTRLIGSSPAIARVRDLLANIAPTDVPVLISGDTGAGKEVVARKLHEMSPRRDRPFVALNCGALPEAMFETEMFGHEAGAFTGAMKRRLGKLEYASGGTLFLDEIESMSPALQVKLLRVLENGLIERLGANEAIRVDCRIVAAAKGDMEALITAGGFRRDLFYRLNVVTVTLPPLSARRDDIVPLFEHFVLGAAVRYQRPAPLLGERRRAELLQREWPGNVRELRNAADRFVLGIPETAEADDAMPDSLSLKERTERFERALIADALRRNKGSVTATAAQLQLPKATLYEKIKRYSLQARGDS